MKCQYCEFKISTFLLLNFDYLNSFSDNVLKNISIFQLVATDTSERSSNYKIEHFISTLRRHGPFSLRYVEVLIRTYPFQLVVATLN